MDIRCLETFIAVAEEQSFSAGAERVYITQSAASKHLHRLEEELGVPLFDRSRRRICLTAAGECMLPYAREMVRQYQIMLNSLKNERPLRIAMLPVAESYGFARLLTEFSLRKNVPAIQMEEHQNLPILHMLKENEIDGAFCRRFDQPFGEKNCIIFREEEMVLLATDSGGPDERVDLSDYKNRGFLFLEKNTGLWDVSWNLCRKAGFNPDIIYTGSASGNIACLVRENAGVALLAEGAARQCLQEGVHMMHLKQSPKSYLTFSCSQEGAAASGMQTLLTFLRKHKSAKA